MSAPAELSLDGLPSPREATLWAGAAALVVVAHAGLYAAYQWLAPRDLPVAAAETMMIELAPLAVSLPEVVESELMPESAPAERLMAEQDYAEPEAAEQAEEAEAAETSEVLPDETVPVENVTETETVEEEPVEQLAAAEPLETLDEVEETVETAEPEPVEPIVEEAEPVEAEPVDPDLVAPETEFPVTPEVLMARPEPAPRVEPVERVAKVEKPRKVEKKPVKAKPRKVVKKKQDAPPKPKAAPKPKKQAAKKRTTEKADGGRVAAKASAPRAASVNPARWHGAVRAAVARRVGSVRGMRGTVRVAFVVSDSGAIVSARVAGSSGNDRLDQAALGMVRSARVPAPPPGLAGGRHAFTVPLSFR